MQNIETKTEIEIEIKEEHLSYKRLDQFLAHKIESLSRAAIKRLFNDKQITSHYPKLEMKSMPPLGTKINIHIPQPIQIDAKPENILLDILYEDQDILVINKQAGIVIHPAPGNYTGTLVNAILFHCKDLQSIGDKIRPGIVHRLDKGTSGVMIVAKNQISHQRLVVDFSNHNHQRIYQAITLNPNISENGTLESFIERSKKDRKKMANFESTGKYAKTDYRVLQYFEKFTHTQLTLFTGRTHQIRVQLSGLLNAPILMDSTYGNPKNHLKLLPTKLFKHLKDYPYPLLHAKLLGITHPISKKKMIFESPPPPIFSETLKILGENQNNE